MTLSASKHLSVCTRESIPLLWGTCHFACIQTRQEPAVALWLLLDTYVITLQAERAAKSVYTNSQLLCCLHCID